ncbi:MAG: hypothetical protein J6R47_04325 [Acholeplasmatales bacterium]|nr:hypothetical protein [Acholeplasmatales bacterium]
MKYKYEIEGNKVTAYCNYAGKRIQASATCCPQDIFDANIGMLYAAKRLDLKIQVKRYKRAWKRMNEAMVHAAIANAEAQDRIVYFNKVQDKLYELEADYDEFIEKNN